MSEVTEIMPCPFCGELPVITKHFKHDIFSFMHRCPVLGPISRDFREKAQDHIDMWNTRTAQSELAALREELASAKADKEAYAQNAIDLRKRMTAAEQRNAEVPSITGDQYEAMNSFFLSICCGDLHSLDKPMIASLCEIGALESCGFGKHRITKFGQYLLAAPKPTESGASE